MFPPRLAASAGLPRGGQFRHPHGATSGVRQSSGNTFAKAMARTDRRVTHSSWLLLGEAVCPEGQRSRPGASPLTHPTLLTDAGWSALVVSDHKLGLFVPNPSTGQA